MTGTRLDTRHVAVSIAGRHLGIFDYKSGGEIDSTDNSYPPGNLGDPVSLGGRRTVGNITVRRLYDLQRDHVISQNYINWVGKAQVVITDQPLDPDGNAFGKPIAYRGTLKRVTFPDHDSTSDDPALLELEITISGYPTGMAG
jgi:hypothetical protein